MLTSFFFLLLILLDIMLVEDYCSLLPKYFKPQIDKVKASKKTHMEMKEKERE